MVVNIFFGSVNSVVGAPAGNAIIDVEMYLDGI